MDKTTQENYDAIMSAKDNELALVDLLPVADNSQKLLDDLKTPSKTAEYRLWAWVVAFAQTTLSTFQTKFVKEVDAAMDSKEPGTIGWWKYIAINFQLGYLLIWNETKSRYEYDDTTSDIAISSRIIKFCSVVDTTGIVVIKVAKDNGSGLPLNLDPVTELPLALAYFKRKRPAGVSINTISLPADLLKITAKVYFDPLLSLPTIQAAVEAAIVNFNNLLPFNGKYNLNKLIDALQAINGVVDVLIDTAEYKVGSDPYVAIVQEYQTQAGYVQIDTAAGNTLTDTLTFIPYV